MQDLRTPKGTLDYSPSQTQTLNHMISKVTTIFEKHNAVPISTPTFELRSILMNKYGEDSKLIFNLEDQGGDICSLRYDLTVPFSRYLSVNKISKMRKYQIGNVFRRDNPSFKTGRLREFIQADFDICGENLLMVNDAEVLKIVCEVLEEFKPYICSDESGKKSNKNSEDYEIRLNDRRILMGMLCLCSVEEKMSGTICSTIDKSDKLSWDESEKEFKEKGLIQDQVESIKRYMMQKGDSRSILAFLKSELETSRLGKLKIEENKDQESKGCLKEPLEQLERALDEMSELLDYLELYKTRNIRLDLSLARGLEYYTGIIFEATFPGKGIGSIIGGGRYDNLCSSISTHSVPCVGFSVGISRLFSIFPEVKANAGIFVGTAYGLLLRERMELLNELWSNGFRAETLSGKRVNFNDQLKYAKKNGFKVALFTGENEIKEDKLILILTETDEKKEIQKSEMVEALRKIFD